MQLAEGVNKKNDSNALNFFFLICDENEIKINKQTFCEGQKSEEISVLIVK